MINRYFNISRDFHKVNDFENEVATWFGAPYGVAVDCCTHGLEL